ncbi:MAG: extracellular solute-binding protein [Firmicutes bacterium]|nr:extracellular solute-binding protein [Bacillota bacterium]
MQKKFLSLLLILILCVAMMLSGCADRKKPSADHPVTLTMWHVYGSQTESPLNTAIDEFNRTVGKEHGVTINVVSVTSSSAIDQALSASTNGEPGAEKLPDLFTAYPRVVQIVGQEKLLSWGDYFAESELSQFKGEFLEEGYFDGNLLMLPIAKSTEAFYLNKTLFDRFSRETGINVTDLTTFDGIFDASKTYYDWSGQRHFLQLNDYYNYAFVGMKAAGKAFIKDGELQIDDPAFRNIWMPLAEAAIYGGICLDDGYAASRWKTAEIIANTGSTADVLYQPDEVIYEDNRIEQITAVAMPYPLFKENKKAAVHRGGGLFAIKSEDERKNYGAYLFAKWLTEKEHNLDFVTAAGYLPVTNEGFDALLSDIDVVKNEKYHSLYTSVGTMAEEYEFYQLPLYDRASEVQQTFEENVKYVLRGARQEYLKQSGGSKDQVLLTQLAESSLKHLIRITSE